MKVWSLVARALETQGSCAMVSVTRAEGSVPREEGARMVITRDGFECQVELLVRLHRMGARMSELPFVLRYDQKPGQSKMQVGRTIRRTLLLMASARLGRLE
mgnify:CR=1 FL=1